MALDFSAGLLGYQQGMQKQEDAKQQMFNKMFPDRDTRKANTQEDWVNSIYKMPGDMFEIKDGKLTGIDGWSGMPTKEAAWNDYVAMSEENRVKPNKLYFEQHYTNAKASFDKELSDKLEGLKASGQFKDKDIQNAIAGLDLHSNYYGNPAIAPFMPQKEGFGWFDIAASTPTTVGAGHSIYKIGQGMLESGPKGAFQAAKKSPFLTAGTKLADWGADKFASGRVINKYKDFLNVNPKYKIQNSKETLKVAKEVLGSKGSKKSGVSALRKAINAGPDEVVKKILKKYGYRKGMVLVGKIFGKAAISTLASPAAVTGVGAVGNAALWAWTAKDIYDVANDLYGAGFKEDSLKKEGAKY